MKLELLFKIIAVIFIGVAAFFLWRGSRDATLVTATLGAVSFFLSVRFQVVERNKQREEQRLKEISAANEEHISSDATNENEKVSPK